MFLADSAKNHHRSSPSGASAARNQKKHRAERASAKKAAQPKPGKPERSPRQRKPRPHHEDYALVPSSSRKRPWHGGSVDYPLARVLQSRTFAEVSTLLLLLGGAALFLALISYVPGDLPRWVPFQHKDPPNSPVHNFIGPVGAVAAGFAYFLFGAASIVIAVLLLGYGVVKIVRRDYRVAPRVPWAVAFILTTACLMELQPWFFRDWISKLNVLGPGGALGFALGDRFFQSLFGPVGAAMLLICLYFVSLFMLTGLAPSRVLAELKSWLPRRWRWWVRREPSTEDTPTPALETGSGLLADAYDLGRDQSEDMATARNSRRSVPRSETDSSEDSPPPEIIQTPEVEIIDASIPAPTEKFKSPRPDPSKNPLGESAKFPGYRLPSLELLHSHETPGLKAANPDELKAVQDTIIDTLRQFGIQVTAGNITKGPTITRYELYPAQGVRVDKIVSLERDIARATRAEGIHIVAPIPGKDTVGVEIANTNKVIVTLRELLQSDAWQQRREGIPIALGKDVYGKTIVADLAKMPHLLVAGATGSGKSVCINSIIASIIFRYSPEDLRFIMVDPKVVELQIYNRLPHMAVPVVTDPKKVLLALRWVINEMEKRYRIFAHVGVKNLSGFNDRFERAARERKLQAEKAERDRAFSQPDLFGDRAARAKTTATPFDAAAATAEGLEAEDGPQETLDGTPIPARLPYIVVIIDELADLMQTSASDVETCIVRIGQMARAAGIHLVVATQTPRADVVTGMIKANIPCRIAFQVSNKVDSRVILDTNGAERLLGQGDMFYLPPGAGKLTRAQGALVTEQEMSEIVDHIAAQANPSYDLEMQETLASGSSSGAVDEITEADEELVQKCLDVIRQEKKASTSMLQRRLRLGYTRAARIVDILEERGILGPGEGAKPREILVDLDAMFGLEVEEQEAATADENPAATGTCPPLHSRAE